MTPHGIARLIESYRFAFSSEAQLQDEITRLFGWKRIPFERERRLNAKDRPDFMLGGTAVEVKIKSSRAAVLTQLHRYALCPEVAGIVLVSNRARHLDMPETLHGKPVAVANLIMGAF